MLEVSKLQVRYDEVIAVYDVDLTVDHGEIVALVGPNGAGKTSTMMAISGVERPASGRISFAGERIDRLPCHRVYARGIVQVPEGRLILNELTVRENLLLGADTLADKARAADDLARMAALFPQLACRLDEKAHVLSGGQSQMLALARGLMGRPKLLLLDEPSLGLAPKVVEELFSTIQELNRQGLSILLVEQNVALALEIADRAYLMEAGRVVDTGPARRLLRSKRVVDAYLGGGSGSNVRRVRKQGVPRKKGGSKMTRWAILTGIATALGLALTGTAGQAGERLAVDYTKEPTSTKGGLEYRYTFTVKTLKDKKPVEAADFTIATDMPSMPGAHHMPHVKAKPGEKPGTYHATIDFDMAGEWNLILRFSKPQRDQIVLTDDVAQKPGTEGHKMDHKAHDRSKHKGN